MPGSPSRRSASPLPGAERSLHVLLIHQLFVTGEEAGGTRHWELATRLIAAGHRVTVIAGSRSYLSGEEHGAPAQLPEGLHLRRIRNLRAGSGFLGRVAQFVAFSVGSVLAALRVRDVDVVMGTTPPIFQAAGARLAAGFKRRPFVLEVRDLWPDFAVELGVLRNPLLIRVARALEHWLYRSADRIVINSPGFRAHIAAVGIAEDRIVLVPNGVEVSHFDPDARGEAFRDEIAVGDEVVVLYAGAHGIPNDLDVVLRAAKLLQNRPDIVFALVGDGRERARLMESAAHLGLENVKFVGAQPKRRMAEILAASDVGLAILQPLPMFATVYPNKVFDYMAAGRPVVLAIDGVIRELVERVQCGVFTPPGDAEALADTIVAYAGDPERRATEGRAGRSAVVAEFARETQAARLLETLEGVVAAGDLRD